MSTFCVASGPGGAPGLLWSFRDAVVESLGPTRFLVRGHGGVVAFIVFGQDRHAQVWQEQRTLVQVIHREGKSIFPCRTVTKVRSNVFGSELPRDQQANPAHARMCGEMFCTLSTLP